MGRRNRTLDGTRLKNVPAIADGYILRFVLILCLALFRDDDVHLDTDLGALPARCSSPIWIYSRESGCKCHITCKAFFWELPCFWSRVEQIAFWNANSGHGFPKKKQFQENPSFNYTWKMPQQYIHSKFFTTQTPPNLNSGNFHRLRYGFHRCWCDAKWAKVTTHIAQRSVLFSMDHISYARHGNNIFLHNK